MIKDNKLILLIILICVLGIISGLIHSYNFFNLVLGFVIAIGIYIGIYIFIRILKGGTVIKKMREYKCIQVERDVSDTQDKLNRLAKDNWKVVCSYAGGNWIILERDNLWY